MAQYGDAVTRRYDTLRKRAGQDARAGAQEEQDAIKRQYARLGNLNSGSYIKQAGMAQDRSEQRVQKATEGVNLAEMAEKAQMDEVQRQRDFLRGERLGSQDFSRGERLGSQDFSAGQAGIQRKFLTSERLGSQGFQSDMQNRQFNYGRDMQSRQNAFTQNMQRIAMEWDQNKFGQQMAFAGRQQDWEELVGRYNMDMADTLMNQQNVIDRTGGLFTKVYKGMFDDPSGSLSSMGNTVKSWF